MPPSKDDPESLPGYGERIPSPKNGQPGQVSWLTDSVDATDIDSRSLGPMTATSNREPLPPTLADNNVDTPEQRPGSTRRG